MVKPVLSMQDQDRITSAVKEAEKRTTGEIAVVIMPRSKPLLALGHSQDDPRKAAEKQFTRLGLHKTKDRIGILLYISLEERCIELLADSGINDKLPTDTWAHIVENFTQEVASDMAGAIIRAVNTCADILAPYFPCSGDNINELPDQVIMGE